MYFPSDYFISIPFVLSFSLTHANRAGTLSIQSLRSCPGHTMAVVSATDILMITVITPLCNNLSQVSYDNVIASLPLYRIQCSCGRSACLIRHGSYTRFLKTLLGKIPLVVQRVLCTLCKTTHSLLPSAIVPYSQVSLADHAAIASSYENGTGGFEAMDANPELSPSQVFYILSLYVRLWRQRLLAERIPLSTSASLSLSCIRLFGRQFMQIKRTRNLLFVPPT